MKKISTLIIALLITVSSFGQQDAQYTQFMFNLLSFNPAYAGSRGSASATAIYRNQWLKIKGAPVSQAVNFHTPLANDRIGLGLSLNYDKIGVSSNTFANMSYAYRIKMGKKAHLAIGLQGTLKYLQVRWSDAQALHIGDGVIPIETSRKFIPNVGAGVFYHRDNFYAGFSVPHMLNNIVYDDNGVILRQKRHFYGMMGFVFKVNENVRFRPSLMTKYVENAPFDMDINASFLFFDQLWTGVSYRLNDSFDAIIQYRFTKQFTMGLAYDYTLTKLSNYTKASVEVMVQYDWTYDRKGNENPRFF